MRRGQTKLFLDVDMLINASESWLSLVVRSAPAAPRLRAVAHKLGGVQEPIGHYRKTPTDDPEMNTPRPLAARGRQVFLEVRKSPLGAGTVAGAVVILVGAALGQSVGIVVLIGVATSMLVAVVVAAAHKIDRQVRNSTDSALLAALIGPSTPVLGTWAIEGDFGQLISQEVQRGRTTVVECGSGVSTLVIAAQLRLQGSGRLYTIEHDPKYAQEAEKRLADMGLGAWVNMIVAPLTEQEVGSDTIRWYDRAQVDPRLPECIDLLIVDGPPSTYPWARWPAVKALHDRLAVGTVVLTDDGRRRYERKTAFRWQSEHDDVELYWHDTVKGTWKLVKLANARPERLITRGLRSLFRLLNPRPQGFGRWPVRR
jgi:predicted O-methyltransferase YrrM